MITLLGILVLLLPFTFLFGLITAIDGIKVATLAFGLTVGFLLTIVASTSAAAYLLGVL